jgi:hypothetical protein
MTPLQLPTPVEVAATLTHTCVGSWACLVVGRHVGCHLRSVRPSDLHRPLAVFVRHVHEPWVAADFAVLDEPPGHLRLDVELELLAAVWTGDREELVHPIA